MRSRSISIHSTWSLSAISILIPKIIKISNCIIFLKIAIISLQRPTLNLSHLSLLGIILTTILILLVILVYFLPLHSLEVFLHEFYQSLLIAPYDILDHFSLCQKHSKIGQFLCTFAPASIHGSLMLLELFLHLGASGCARAGAASGQSLEFGLAGCFFVFDLILNCSRETRYFVLYFLKLSGA